MSVPVSVRRPVTTSSSVEENTLVVPEFSHVPSKASSRSAQVVQVRRLGTQDYRAVWQAMRDFTKYRTVQTLDEIWLVEHPPVFTLGQAGKPEHLLDPGAIPVVETDRGGQVTYHGPGQLLVYVLLDLRRLGIGARGLVSHLEAAVVALLADYEVTASSRPKAPGVYVGEKKVAVLGLRIRRGCCYHGLSLNVDLDLEPFSRINPCGYAGLEVTQTREVGISAGADELGERLVGQLLGSLGYYVGRSDDLPPALLSL